MNLLGSVTELFEALTIRPISALFHVLQPDGAVSVSVLSNLLSGSKTQTLANSASGSEIHNYSKS